MTSPGDVRQFEDVPLTVEARISCKPLSIAALMALTPGTVVVSDRAAGDNVDVAVSDQSLAAAELIVIENRLAVRFSDFAEKK